MLHVSYISIEKHILYIGYELGIVLVSGYNMEKKDRILTVRESAIQVQRFFSVEGELPNVFLLGSVGGRILVSGLIGEDHWFGLVNGSGFMNFLKLVYGCVIGT